MYPTINLGNGIFIYTFGLCMIMAWAIFFILLHYLSIRRGFQKHIFASIIDFTLVIFLCSRIFYILAEWRTERFLFVDLSETGNIFVFLKEFFITDNYSLSFAGGIIGFMLVFLWKTRENKKDRAKYWNIIIPAFLLAAPVGYIGTLFGGQIYGIVSDVFFSITYRNLDSIVPFQNPTFPLPLVYTIMTLSIAGFLYRLEHTIELPEGFIGYIGMGIFSIMLFLFEFLSGASDLFSSRLYININQIVTLGFIFYAFLGILRIIKS